MASVQDVIKRIGIDYDSLSDVQILELILSLREAWGSASDKTGPQARRAAAMAMEPWKILTRRCMGWALRDRVETRSRSTDTTSPQGRRQAIREALERGLAGEGFVLACIDPAIAAEFSHALSLFDTGILRDPLASPSLRKHQLGWLPEARRGIISAVHYWHGRTLSTRKACEHVRRGLAAAGANISVDQLQNWLAGKGNSRLPAREIANELLAGAVAGGIDRTRFFHKFGFADDVENRSAWDYAATHPLHLAPAPDLGRLAHFYLNCRNLAKHRRAGGAAETSARIRSKKRINFTADGNR